MFMNIKKINKPVLPTLRIHQSKKMLIILKKRMYYSINYILQFNVPNSSGGKGGEVIREIDENPEITIDPKKVEEIKKKEQE